MPKTSTKTKVKPAKPPAKKNGDGTASPYFETLRSCYLFADADTASIAAVAQRVKLEIRPAGTVLLDINKESDQVYIIERGKVKITKMGADKVELVLNILERGSVIGESRVIDDGKQSVRVTCLEETHLLAL